MISSISNTGYASSALSMQRMDPPPRPSSDQFASDLISQADTDDDGALTETELTDFLEENHNVDSETAAQLFSDLDSDGDGVATEAEVNEALSSMMQQMHADRFQQRGLQGPPPPPPAEDFASSMISSAITSADSDEDGELSQTEFTSLFNNGDEGSDLISALFDQADTDGNSTLSQAELETAISANDAQRRQTPGGFEGAMNHFLSAYGSSVSNESTTLSTSA